MIGRCPDCDRFTSGDCGKHGPRAEIFTVGPPCGDWTVDWQARADRLARELADARTDIAACVVAMDADTRLLDERAREIDRLEATGKAPVCNDCGAELGDNWCADCAAKGPLDALRAEHARELAAAQAREADARRVLYAITHDESTDGVDCAERWEEAARTALAIPADDTALRAALAEARRSALREAADVADRAWPHGQASAGTVAARLRRMADEGEKGTP